MTKKRFVCSILAVVLFVSVLFSATPSTTIAEGSELTAVQRNAIAMVQ